MKSDVIDAIKEDMEQFLTFYVGTELFAMKILEVKELVEYSSVTYIPMMQKFIHGVINLRGNVIPIVDLSERLGRQPCQVSKRTSIIFAELDSDEGEINIGILVDAVAEVVDIPLRNVEKAPDFGAKIPSYFIQGIGKINDEFVILLQLQAVLNIADLSKIEEANTIEKKIQRKRDIIPDKEIS